MRILIEIEGGVLQRVGYNDLGGTDIHEVHLIDWDARVVDEIGWEDVQVLAEVKAAKAEFAEDENRGTEYPIPSGTLINMDRLIAKFATPNEIDNLRKELGDDPE